MLCTLLFFFIFLFYLLHLPTKICPRFSLVERSTFDLKLQHDVQNGLSLHSDMFLGNLTLVKTLELFKI